MKYYCRCWDCKVKRINETVGCCPHKPWETIISTKKCAYVAVYHCHLALLNFWQAQKNIWRGSLDAFVFTSMFLSLLVISRSAIKQLNTINLFWASGLCRQECHTYLLPASYLDIYFPLSWCHLTVLSFTSGTCLHPILCLVGVPCRYSATKDSQTATRQANNSWCL